MVRELEPLQPNESFIVAPMDGTFWHRPAPDQPQFIAEGSSFVVGETLGLIEVMKTFSPIKAKRPGTLIKLHVGDGEGTEAAEVLLRVRYET